MPSTLLQDVWREAAVAAVLLVILYAGHRGWWYWSPGVRALTAELARERDDWRTLAVTLLRKEGLDLPAGFERGGAVELPGPKPPT